VSTFPVRQADQCVGGARLGHRRAHTPARDPVDGRQYLPVAAKGLAVMNDPLLNKGSAFTECERDALGLHGLLPPHVGDIETQLARVREGYDRQPDDLARYLALIALQDRNETLFYRFLIENLEEMLPIVYTPTVGEACRRFSHIYRQPRGVYVTAADVGRMDQVLANVPAEDVSVIVATDGEGILGIGDQGAGSIGISIGKLTLYTVAAGIHPAGCLPVCIDVGTDNAELRADPLYMGTDAPRLRGEPYFAVIDAFVDAVQRRYPHALLQWEDLSRQNAWTVLARHRDRICSFNDDIQGTSAVVVAGMRAAAKITGRALRDERICLYGLGAAGGGILHLLTEAMGRDGLAKVEARERFLALDSQGPVLSSRARLADYKQPFARDPRVLTQEGGPDPRGLDLLQVIQRYKPTVLIGTSGHAGSFTEPVMRAMAANVERPVVLALSNPTSRSEVLPEDALRWTDGRVLFATGSPFPPVGTGASQRVISQGNNVLCFPGIGLGVVAAGATRVTDGMLLAAAEALAAEVTPEQLACGEIYPSLLELRTISANVALAVARAAVHEGVARTEMGELVQRIADEVWYPDYVPYRESGPLPWVPKRKK